MFMQSFCEQICGNKIVGFTVASRGVAVAKFLYKKKNL